MTCSRVSIVEGTGKVEDQDKSLKNFIRIAKNINDSKNSLTYENSTSSKKRLEKNRTMNN